MVGYKGVNKHGCVGGHEGVGEYDGFGGYGGSGGYRCGGLLTLLGIEACVGMSVGWYEVWVGMEMLVGMGVCMCTRLWSVMGIRMDSEYQICLGVEHNYCGGFGLRVGYRGWYWGLGGYVV